MTEKSEKLQKALDEALIAIGGSDYRLHPMYAKSMDQLAAFLLKIAAPQSTEQKGAQPIETAPKDGTVILVYFKLHGWLTVSWDDPYGDNRDNGLWCVSDGKNSPKPVRGYTDNQLTVWMPLPPPPTDSGGSHE